MMANAVAWLRFSAFAMSLILIAVPAGSVSNSMTRPREDYPAATPPPVRWPVRKGLASRL